jgi:hypothetical protein
MKLFRLIFDAVAFLIPLFYPTVLLLYIIIHIWFPFIVKLPKRFDIIQHKLNIQIPFTLKN